MFDDLDRFRTKDAWPQPSTDPANFDQSALCLNFAGPTKYEKLIAVMERFYALTTNIQDDQIQSLHQCWIDARKDMETWLSDPISGVKKSALAQGLEQGLREIPDLLYSLSAETRGQALCALNAALAESFPDFLDQNKKRLEKVCARGRIRTEAEFYMVRYEIDRLEGETGHRDQLQALYALVDEFESGSSV